jgi:type II pantothenate kinase
VLRDLLDTGRITVVETDNDTPLIDLRKISDECNEAARDSDLIILEGMGRSVESNFEAKFRCDSLKIAMLKDKMVAAKLGGEVFDLVCRFDQTDGGPVAESDEINLPRVRH